MRYHLTESWRTVLLLVGLFFSEAVPKSQSTLFTSSKQRPRPTNVPSDLPTAYQHILNIVTRNISTIIQGYDQRYTPNISETTRASPSSISPAIHSNLDKSTKSPYEVTNNINTSSTRNTHVDLPSTMKHSTQNYFDLLLPNKKNSPITTKYPKYEYVTRENPSELSDLEQQSLLQIYDSLTGNNNEISTSPSTTYLKHINVSITPNADSGIVTIITPISYKIKLSSNVSQSDEHKTDQDILLQSLPVKLVTKSSANVTKINTNTTDSSGIDTTTEEVDPSTVKSISTIVDSTTQTLPETTTELLVENSTETTTTTVENPSNVFEPYFPNLNETEVEENEELQVVDIVLASYLDQSEKATEDSTSEKDGLPTPIKFDDGTDTPDNNETLLGREFETPHHKMIEEATQYGLNMMKERYDILEPKLYSLGLSLESNNPARYVAAFSRQTEEAKTLAKYGYAALHASTKLAEELKYGKSDGGEDAIRHRTVSSRNTALHDECPLRGVPRCSPASRKYRTADGTCNNPLHPRRGSANMPMMRFISPDYDDGIQSVRRSVVFGQSLPSARDISDIIHTDRNVELTGVTHILMQWGQFLDHDLTQSAQGGGFNGSVPRCCRNNGQTFQPTDRLHPDCLPIDVSPKDSFLGPMGIRCMEFVRSAPTSRVDCVLGWREQINQVTAYIDASSIYGNSFRHADSLRTFRNGMLAYARTMEDEDLQTSELCHRGAVSSSCFHAGDNRASEQPGLTALHIAWVRQHNLMASSLANINPHWSDEKLYQEARRIVAAMIQHITFREFLPIILGQEVMKLFDLQVLRKGYYDNYDPKVNPGPANSFATAAYRFGHSLVQPSFVRTDRHHRPLFNNVSLHMEQENPANIWEFGSLDRIILGMCNQPSQKRDEFITEELTNHLFQTTGFPFGMDLAAINIQRGRDHGIPSYTAWRDPCGLTPVNTWSDLAKLMSKDTLFRLQSLYDHIDDIDLFTGGLAEKPLRGGLVGPTFACIIAQQFSNLRRGDRFWYENGDFESSFSPQQLQQIRKVTLAHVFCQTMDGIDTIQPFVFLSPDNFRNGRISCNDPILTNFDLTHWIENGQHNENFIPDFDTPDEFNTKTLSHKTFAEDTNTKDEINLDVKGILVKFNSNDKITDRMDVVVRNYSIGANKEFNKLAVRPDDIVLKTDKEDFFEKIASSHIARTPPNQKYVRVPDETREPNFAMTTNHSTSQIRQFTTLRTIIDVDESNIQNPYHAHKHQLTHMSIRVPPTNRPVTQVTAQKVKYQGDKHGYGSEDWYDEFPYPFAHSSYNSNKFSPSHTTTPSYGIQTFQAVVANPTKPSRLTKPPPYGSRPYDDELDLYYDLKPTPKPLKPDDVTYLIGIVQKRTTTPRYNSDYTNSKIDYGGRPNDHYGGASNNFNHRPSSNQYNRPQNDYQRPQSSYNRPQSDNYRPQSDKYRPQSDYNRPYDQRPQNTYNTFSQNSPQYDVNEPTESNYQGGPFLTTKHYTIRPQDTYQTSYYTQHKLTTRQNTFMIPTGRPPRPDMNFAQTIEDFSTFHMTPNWPTSRPTTLQPYYEFNYGFSSTTPRPISQSANGYGTNSGMRPGYDNYNHPVVRPDLDRPSYTGTVNNKPYIRPQLDDKFDYKPTYQTDSRPIIVRPEADDDFTVLNNKPFTRPELSNYNRPSSSNDYINNNRPHNDLYETIPTKRPYVTDNNAFNGYNNPVDITISHRPQNGYSQNVVIKPSNNRYKQSTRKPEIETSIHITYEQLYTSNKTRPTNLYDPNNPNRYQNPSQKPVKLFYIGNVLHKYREGQEPELIKRQNANSNSKKSSIPRRQQEHATFNSIEPKNTVLKENDDTLISEALINSMKNVETKTETNIEAFDRDNTAKETSTINSAVDIRQSQSTTNYVQEKNQTIEK